MATQLFTLPPLLLLAADALLVSDSAGDRYVHGPQSTYREVRQRKQQNKVNRDVCYTREEGDKRRYWNFAHLLYANASFACVCRDGFMSDQQSVSSIGYMSL